MFIWLVKKYSTLFSDYFISIKFRAIVSFLTTLIISFILTPSFIKFLKKLQINQIIRKNGPKSHLLKNNTPTMGGIIILVTTIFSVLIWTDLCNKYIWYVLFLFVSYGIIGFIDDYKKIFHQHTNGLTIFWKYFWQSLIALIIVILLYLFDNKNITQIIIPTFYKNYTLDIGIFFILISYFVITGTSNSVNLTDGLDGLVILPIIFVCITLTIVSFISGDIVLSKHFNFYYLYYSNEFIIFCASIIGAGMSFLWFNKYPAKLFMGDVGSLALGGTIGILSILLHQELLLLIIGGIFVIESLSVMLQIISFKLRKKRIFKMAPIHHHYELKGYSEPFIIIRFWIFSFICFIVGLLSLKIY
ncbi:phospho-N-acetylmuramoyl-pentapeptide-transferase [Candidatus Tachikawaea gelatinosa]|uniref:Phospho-N-acetylmuramoyl-pentapeptide-transferase n=1 Tax=Candidatus Tachikawaea gelatinosa TaxID=1410383 RepID=A0A090AJ49_9ENTR|nr:phospho-N-acetylmuramoyl-pentapeptide-transferase [Candidatus Tachikawaea gelatinosa]BAP58463.1 phospho-N-acetylmuramoyl-pentapeptide-transferase [Candidatus Tachikawaea gelatinosa]